MTDPGMLKFTQQIELVAACATALSQCWHAMFVFRACHNRENFHLLSKYYNTPSFAYPLILLRTACRS